MTAGVDIEALPIHRYIGVTLIDPDRPQDGIQFTVHPGIEGRPGQLNFGVISLLIDAAAYLALQPSFEPGEDAVTHDIHESVLRSVASGEVVQLRGRVVQRGRRVSFLEAEATVAGRLVATARVTKTMVREPG